MADARIFIVEDEGIVALDLRERLRNLGYTVLAIASYGEEAISRAGEIQPDLILMDIKLKGKVDGIQASEQIRERYDIPVIYLTAFADEHTLGRAQITEPYGYVLKPFDEQQLQTTIEMALYRHKMEKKLRENEQWLSTTLKSIGDAVITTDTEGLVTFMNPVAEVLTGWKQDEGINQPLSLIFKLIDELSRLPIVTPITSVLRDGNTIFLAEHNILVKKDGNEIPIDDSLAPIKDDKGSIIGSILVFRDITSRRKSDEALRRSESRFRNIISQSPIGIALCDRSGHLIEANPVILDLFGVNSFTDLEGLCLFDDRTLTEDLKSRIRAGEVVKYQNRIDYDQLERTNLFQNKKSESIYLDYLITPWMGMGDTREGYLLQVQDITDRKLAEERILHDARHDSLTGLPNRSYFLDQLNRADEQCKRRKEYLAAVLFMDLDRFKIVNDSLGHAAGDQMLVIISQRLKNCLRPGDFIARFGGDEFAILLDDINQIGDATNVAERILMEVSPPISLRGQEVYISTSIGIALASRDDQSPEDLLRDADTALYRAKNSGKARYAIFDTQMHARNLALLELEADLRTAVEREEFLLYYEPLISSVSGLIVGTDAVLRWQNPKHGWVSSSEFLPLAEETGLIFPIGEWALHKACAQTKAWQDIAHAPLRVRVNITPKQLQIRELKKFIRKVLTATGLHPEYLELGIRQDATEHPIDLTLKAMRELKSLNVRTSIYNFGQALSSLDGLNHLPADTLIIDQSFISRFPQHEYIAGMITAMVAMGRALGLYVAAEGVETQEQLDFLLPLCDEIQGGAVSTALSAEDMTVLLQKGKIEPLTAVR